MSAGELRERVRFERRAEAGDDGYGNVTYAWQLIAGPMAARIKPMQGSEQLLAQGLTGINRYEITVRYCAATRALDAGDRCIDERTDAIYNIRSITNPDEHRRYIETIGELGVAT